MKILPSPENNVGLPIQCLNLIALFAAAFLKKQTSSYFMEKESNDSYWIIVGFIYIQSVS